MDTALSSLFTSTPDMPHLHGNHHLGLVVMSVFVAMVAATMALQIAQIARRTKRVRHRHLAIATGAIALGAGIWSMHFIGMLAWRLPFVIEYSWRLTALSLVPACITAWFILRILVQHDISLRKLVLSGIGIGIGIAVMHYIGMEAIEAPWPMRYRPDMFVLSLVIALSLAVAVLWVRYRLRLERLNHAQRRIGRGILMGLAIAGIHYSSMIAVYFVGTADTAHRLLATDLYAALALASLAVTMALVAAAVHTLTYSQELRRAVEGTASRLHATLDTAVDGIITINPLGSIQSFNRSAERLFGYSAAEVCGKNVKMLMPEPYQSRHDGYLHNYMSTGNAKIIGVGREITGLRKDGSLMPMRLAVGRVDLPNELLFVGIVTDISDRHALEASLRDTAERAQQAAAVKGAFLANMSHEIRTPMNAIIGFAELLLQGALSESQRQHLTTIRQSSRLLLGLLNDILDTAKMESGRLELEHTDFSLKLLVEQVHASLALSAETRQLGFEIFYSDDMQEYFQGDPLRITQILTNLVSNAIKFTKRGTVTVSLSQQQGWVHIQVQDSGIGMTAEQLAKIFTPFTQADASISRNFGGTGLGTSIARQLTELMGGRIKAESIFGEGSTFHVWLPLPAGQAPLVTDSEVSLSCLPALHILVADDVPQNLELLTLNLEATGHRVVQAQDGSEAFEKFCAGRFDVVLMDVHMPITSGLCATRLIREHERNNQLAHTPIIALTASVMSADRHAAREAGMDGFAVKPLDMPRLFDEVARVLNITLSPDFCVQHQKTIAEPPLPTSAVIDWQTGIKRWGDEAHFVNALRQFLHSVAGQYPLPTAPDAPLDWERVLFSLHGLRGAAANLSLPEVAHLAAILEQQVRDGDYALAQQRLPELLTRIASAQQEAASYQPSSPVQLHVVDGATDHLEAVGSADLQSAMRTLLQVLAHNELDDAALDTVCYALQQRQAHSAAQALRTAIDNFEFPEAQRLLEQLLETIH